MDSELQVALDEEVGLSDTEQMVDQKNLEIDKSRSSCRRVVINGHLEELQVFPSNRISTAKYGLLTFLPKFLFEQFQRYSNVFFLFIAILQQIPGVSPTGRWNTLVPLVIVLSATALKEIIEDWKRHKADHEINDRLVRVFRNGAFQMMKWTQVVVGDVVKIVNAELFPADLLLLSSSEPNAICYIETSNLDGETNLKIRQGSVHTAHLLSSSTVGSLQGVIECEHPNNRLYEFVGNMIVQGQATIPLGPSQLLLRGSQLKNTQWVYGAVLYTGHDSKLMQNSTAAPIKRSRMDRITNVQILLLFLLLLVLALISASIGTSWIDANKKKLWYLASADLSTPNFFLEFLTFIIVYNNLIPISLIVTIEFVKFIQAYLMNLV
jgi:phospholipid-transporting ATPase